MGSGCGSLWLLLWFLVGGAVVGWCQQVGGLRDQQAGPWVRGVRVLGWWFLVRVVRAARGGGWQVGALALVARCGFCGGSGDRLGVVGGLWVGCVSRYPPGPRMYAHAHASERGG